MTQLRIHKNKLGSVDIMKPIVYPAIATNLFHRTKNAYDDFKGSLRPVYCAWYHSSEADKKYIRNTYHNKYIDFNAYHAVKYLISLIKGRKISCKWEIELLFTIVEDREH
jgi:hypothetical protein